MRYFIFAMTVFPFFSYAQDYKSVVRANNALAFDLYYEASQKSDFLLSPVSISSAMAMTYAGARGETKEQIKRVFHFPNDDQLNNGSLGLSNILQQRYENSTLAIANKLWVGQGRIALDSSFVNLNKKYYSAALQTLRFDNNSLATKTINDWVAAQTKDKIKDLLDPDFISGDLILILINAVYFKSSWQDRFDPQNTIAGKFITEKDNKIDALFMTQKRRNYTMWQNEFVNMIELPFANTEFSLDILLPIKNMRDLEENFLIDEYEMWLTKAYKVTFTTVQIPKFKTNFKIELSDALTDMGMGKAFADAEFEGMGQADGPIRISKVVHQTFMEVNEDGAEASAATAIGMATRSMPVDHQFIADHPFIYILRHVKTNTILFIGKMSNPSY